MEEHHITQYYLMLYIMDSKVNLLIDRSENEILAAQVLKRLSEEDSLKTEFNLPISTSFYSSVISHAYYSIFYCAKAYLIHKNISLSKQGQHQQVYFKFKKLVKKGIIETELLKIYEDVKGKAEVLLDILKTEKDKRTNFSYETIPQANQQPAEDSLNNAIFFISHIKELLNTDYLDKKEEKK
jgi:uncharacterized protein (UPF0332 family)